MIRENSLLGCCSSRIDSERSIESPELIIVENCRLKIASSLSFTCAPSLGRLMSVFSPPFLLGGDLQRARSPCS